MTTKKTATKKTATKTPTKKVSKKTVKKTSTKKTSKKKAEATETKPKTDKKIIGDADYVASRFSLGDLVRVHLEMENRVFTMYPHGEKGIVISLTYEDEEHFYNLPVVQFATEQRMFEPTHLIVDQKSNGDKGEVKLLAAAKAAIIKHEAKEKADAAADSDGDGAAT